MRPSSWAMLVGGAMAGGIFESTFAAAAPFPANIIRPVLPCLVMLVLLTRSKPALFGAGIAGACLDLLSATPAGFATARLLIVMLCVEYLAEHVATNRSLFSAMALAFFAGILNWAFLLLEATLGNLVLSSHIFLEPWSTYLLIALANVAITASLFLVFTLFTKRFLISIKTQ
ncbi:MAG: hypothetical protein WCW31_01580 [Patescibacteria group bacterium]